MIKETVVKVPFRKLKYIHHISDIQIRNLKRHKEYEQVFERTYQEIKKNKVKIDGQEIKEILTVNGVRFSFNDGSWGLIRASSNKPSLVVVTESTGSDKRKKKIFDFIDDLLQKTGKIGEYDQKI